MLADIEDQWMQISVELEANIKRFHQSNRFTGKATFVVTRGMKLAFYCACSIIMCVTNKIAR